MVADRQSQVSQIRESKAVPGGGYRRLRSERVVELDRVSQIGVTRVRQSAQIGVDCE